LFGAAVASTSAREGADIAATAAIGTSVVTGKRVISISGYPTSVAAVPVTRGRVTRYAR
jgi:hypothetical protein